MSSTLRGYKRHVSDYYVTPISEIDKFLKELTKVIPDVLDGYILDCCAGGDKNNLMSYPTSLLNYGVSSDKIQTMDIREDSLANIKGNYLEQQLKQMPDLIITNPPFSHAEEIINKGLNDVSENGYVIMLLRLNFFGSKKRFEFWKEHMPEYCFVHHQRMSFTDDGKTDSIEYAHFVWNKSIKPEYTKIKVI